MTTLDVISGGRAVLSRVGWDVAEHEATGSSFPGSASGSTGWRRNWPSAVPCSGMSRRPSPGSSTRCGMPATHRGRCEASYRCSWPGTARSARWTWPHATDACNVLRHPADVRRKLDVLHRHCERAGRNPAEITRTAVEFDARDLGALTSSARALARGGRMIVACPDDPARITAIGRVLGESFPD